MNLVLDDAIKRAVHMKSNEQFVHTIPLKVTSMDIYLERLVHQNVLTAEEVKNMDFFDKAQKCYAFYIKALFE